jgi:hypothetical protein
MRELTLLAVALAGCTRPSPDYCDPSDPSCSPLTDGGRVSVLTPGTSGSRGTSSGARDGGGTSSGGRDDGGTSAAGTSSDGGGTGSSGSDGGMGSATLPTGAPCLGSATPPSTTDDCVAGDVCSLSHGARDVTFCRQRCRVDGDCQQTTYPGGLAPFCEGATASSAGTCTISCAPVGATVGGHGCSAGLACYSLPDRTRSPTGVTLITDCVAPGSGQELAACSVDFDCAPGYVCVNAIFASLCRVLCTSASDCPTGEACNAFLNTLSSYGYCA